MCSLVKRLTKRLARLVPWENGPKVERTPAFNRLLDAFRLDSPALDTTTTQADRVRRLVAAAPVVCLVTNYRAALAELVATYQATNVTVVQLRWIEHGVFGRLPPRDDLTSWLRRLTCPPDRLTPLEFVLVYGALEQCLPTAATRTRRRPPPGDRSGKRR